MTNEKRLLDTYAAAAIALLLLTSTAAERARIAMVALVGASVGLVVAASVRALG